MGVNHYPYYVVKYDETTPWTIRRGPYLSGLNIGPFLRRRDAERCLKIKRKEHNESEELNE